MRLLCSLGRGAVLPRLGIVLSEVFHDVVPGCSQGELREVCGVGSHIGDETLLIQALSHSHRGVDREVQLSGRLLLHRGCGERGCRASCGCLLVDTAHPEFGSGTVLEELPGLVNCPEPGPQCGIDLHIPSFGSEDCVRLVVGFPVEGHDLPLPVHYKPQGHALHPSRRELRLNLSPEDRRHLETYQPVQNPSGLLGIDEVHVYVPRVLDGIEDGLFGNFVEDNPFCILVLESENFVEMPGYRLSFPVFIGCKPYRLDLSHKFLQFGDNLFLVSRNDVLGREPVFDIHAQFIVLKVPDVSYA